ncbi:MAG: restriction endonuclease subunit S [Dysosmobacter sp.]
MMLSAGNGFIMQSDKYSRDNAGQSLKKYTLLKKGELAYNHGASKAKQFGCCYELLEEEARIPYVYHCFKVQDTEYTPYVALELNNTKMDKQLKRLVSSSVRMDGLLNISYDEYMSVVIYLPAYAEQKHIADFLEKLDMRIAKQEQLIEALKKYKRGLLSQLISGKQGFRQKQGWNIVKLGDIFTERNEKANGGEELLAVTINAGVQKRSEIDLKDNSSDDKSNYKRVKIGDIAYNTMRMWQGASGASSYDGIVSPAYTVITPIHPQQINILFWAQYFKYEPLVKTFQKFSQGLTSDTWNLKFPQFSEIKVLCPSYDEQNLIATLLVSFELRIKLEEEKLEQINRMRASLNAQLFI